MRRLENAGRRQRSGAFQLRRYASIKAVDSEQIFCLALQMVAPESPAGWSGEGESRWAEDRRVLRRMALSSRSPKQDRGWRSLQLEVFNQDATLPAITRSTRPVAQGLSGFSAVTVTFAYSPARFARIMCMRAKFVISLASKGQGNATTAKRWRPISSRFIRRPAVSRSRLAYRAACPTVTAVSEDVTSP